MEAALEYTLITVYHFFSFKKWMGGYSGAVGRYPCTESPSNNEQLHAGMQLPYMGISVYVHLLIFF